MGTNPTVPFQNDCSRIEKMCRLSDKIIVNLLMIQKLLVDVKAKLSPKEAVKFLTLFDRFKSKKLKNPENKVPQTIITGLLTVMDTYKKVMYVNIINNGEIVRIYNLSESIIVDLMAIEDLLLEVTIKIVLDDRMMIQTNGESKFKTTQNNELMEIISKAVKIMNMYKEIMYSTLSTKFDISSGYQ